MEREKLKSRLGFILLSAGCAIGIGNVWKFPYMAGQGGGGAFVLFYLLFLVILGLPIMTMEFAVGRASHKSPVRAYQALEKPGQKWHIHGYFTLIGCYLLRRAGAALRHRDLGQVTLAAPHVVAALADITADTCVFHSFITSLSLGCPKDAG